MRLDYRPAALLALKQHNEDSFADIERVHKFPIAAQHSRELNFIELPAIPKKPPVRSRPLAKKINLKKRTLR
jgi:hypothetical protein